MITGDEGKLYVDNTSKKLYEFNGSIYVQLNDFIQQNADWYETNPLSVKFIENKPTIPTSITNLNQIPTRSYNDLQDLPDLSLKADLVGGKVPLNQIANSVLNQQANAEAYADGLIATLVGSSPVDLDTIQEISAALQNNPNIVQEILTSLANRLRFDINNQGLSATEQLNAQTNLDLVKADLLDRTNHTGSQAISTITNLQSILDGKEPTITGGTSSQFWRGDKTWQTLDTSAVPENSNLYFTDTRARNAISLTTTGSGVSTYNSTTGEFNIPTPKNLINKSIDLLSVGGTPNPLNSNWRTNYTTLNAFNVDLLSTSTSTLLTTSNIQWQRIFANNTTSNYKLNSYLIFANLSPLSDWEFCFVKGNSALQPSSRVIYFVGDFSQVTQYPSGLIDIEPNEVIWMVIRYKGVASVNPGSVFGIAHFQFLEQ